MNKEKIMARVEEHYKYLESLGYEVVCTCLQGSQNYGLDEYSEDYCSDIDTKSIVLPKLRDFIMALPPISKVEVMDNDEHAEVKDIRIMFEMLRKMNISYIELLYSKYVYINPKWKDYIYNLFLYRDEIASFNRNQFIKCIYGMALEKQKALCHPYPATMDKIEKFGYDGKQLSHCRRLLNFLSRYLDGEPIASCYEVQEPAKTILMNNKKQLDANGEVLSLASAKSQCDAYVAAITVLKNDAVTEFDGLEYKAVEILEDIKYEILKEQMRRELSNV
jgi:predicted nucleotidyltransferase